MPIDFATGDSKVAKMGKFWPKSQAIHLVFSSKFAENTMWVILSGALKSGKNGRILAKSKPIHLPLLANLHSKSLTCEWFWVKIRQKYQVYSLTFWPKSKPIHLPLLANLHSKSLTCEWFWVKIRQKYQVYSLTFWPKVSPYTCHFWRISTQNHSHVSDFESKFAKSGKCIALLFGQKVSPYTCHFWRISTQNHSHVSDFRQNSPKYQVYSLTFWPKFAHFCHFSISTQNHSHWILVKIRQNTKCIALLFGQNSPIFANFQSPLKITHIEFWWKFAKIPSV